jgi:L-fuconate dehydratase
MIEYVDHLHEHFVDPVKIDGGRYLAPRLPGSGAEMLPESRERWTFPTGQGWLEIGNRAAVTAGAGA